MKHIIISFIFLGILLPTSAQKGEVLNKFDLRFGMVDNGQLLNYSGTKGNLRVDFDYNLNKFIGLGCYIGYAQFKTVSYSEPPSDTHIYGEGYYYGINAYYHFSPLFLKSETQSKFDLYLKGKIGGISTKLENNTTNTRFDYGVYLGASYYPLKRFGLNAEFGYGETSISKIGVAIKLGKLSE